MFKHQNKTNFPPHEKPLIIWDGECGLCHFWIIRWKMITGDKIEYRTFQNAAGNFPDIPVDRFREAVRLIETDGSISSGPRAAFKSLSLVEKHKWLLQLYQKSGFFRAISDNIYQLVAVNREVFFKLTKHILGKNPRSFKAYWIWYLIILVLLILLILLL